MIDVLTLADITYPVFRLGLNKPEKHEGVLYYPVYKDTDNPKSLRLRVVDDTKIPRDTLAARRLVLAAEEAPLHRIRNGVYFLGDLLKLATPKTWFIDAKGVLFRYRKTSRAKLITLPISKITNIATGGSIIEVYGMLTRFKSLYVPEETMTYVGLLNIGMSYILYNFYAKEQPESWRRI